MLRIKLDRSANLCGNTHGLCNEVIEGSEQAKKGASLQGKNETFPMM